jgi:hypothetical protein
MRFARDITGILAVADHGRNRKPAGATAAAGRNEADNL